MSSTKIINVLKTDPFEDILDLYNSTSAQEVIFVLPKKAKAFSSEEHFALLAHASTDSGKTATFMSSDSNVRSLARQYGYSVLGGEAKKAAAPKKVVATPTNVSLMDYNENEDAFEKDLDDVIDLIRPSDEGEEEKDEEDDLDHEDHPKPSKNRRSEMNDIYDEDEEEDIEDEKESFDEEDEEDEDEEEIEEDELEKIGDEESDAETISVNRSLPRATFAVANNDPPSRVTNDLEGIVMPRETRSVKVSPDKSKKVSVGVRRESPEEFTEDLNQVWQRSSPNPLWADLGRNSESKPWKQGFSFRWPRFRAKTLLVTLAVISGLALLAVLFFVEGKAVIAVKPKSSNLDFSIKVAALDSVASVDNQFNRIPGQVFKIEKSVSGEFNSTGQKEVAQKARGTITVYNELSTPQTLIATTRFQYTTNGNPTALVFRTLATINIPAGGKANVEIVADKAGQEYNVGPGRFVVTAFREKGDTARYENIYGQSTENFRGGISGNARVVAEKDYNDAKTLLTTQLTDQIKKSISEQASGLVIIQSQDPKINEVKSSASIDEAVERFSMDVFGSAIIVGFRETDLHKLIDGYVSKTNNLTVRPNELTIKYSDISLAGNSNGLDFRTSIKGPGYQKVDPKEMVKNLKGKNQEQLETYLKSLSFIESAQVTLSPFWIRKVPLDDNKVIIKII